MGGVPSAVSISSTIQTSASDAGEPCHEQLPLTSTPCTTSQAVQRKRKRLQRFLDGKANAAYEFNTALHGSFSSFSSDDADTTPARKKSEFECTHGCCIPLISLCKSFEAISEQPAKTLLKRRASYRL